MARTNNGKKGQPLKGSPKIKPSSRPSGLPARRWLLEQQHKDEKKEKRAKEAKGDSETHPDSRESLFSALEPPVSPCRSINSAESGRGLDKKIRETKTKEGTAKGGNTIKVVGARKENTGSANGDLLLPLEPSTDAVLDKHKADASRSSKRVSDKRSMTGPAKSKTTNTADDSLLFPAAPVEPCKVLRQTTRAMYKKMVDDKTVVSKGNNTTAPAITSSLERNGENTHSHHENKVEDDPPGAYDVEGPGARHVACSAVLRPEESQVRVPVARDVENREPERATHDLPYVIEATKVVDSDDEEEARIAITTTARRQHPVAQAKPAWSKRSSLLAAVGLIIIGAAIAVVVMFVFVDDKRSTSSIDPTVQTMEPSTTVTAMPNSTMAPTDLPSSELPPACDRESDALYVCTFNTTRNNFQQ